MLLSVIIPIYNGEKHMDRAVQSILPQLDGRVEMILVDDGSTDKTGVICDQYALQHPDIKVVHKQNGGISSARNAGMDIAQGEYLSFLDSDDFWEEGSCKEICKVILREKPDIFDFGWRYVTDGVALTPAFHKLPKNTLLNIQTIKEKILPPLLNIRDDPECFIFDFCWNKVFRKEIIFTYGVRFEESRRTWEDRPFLVRFLKHCINFYSMDQCFYNYVDTPNSLGRRYCIDIFNIILDNYHLYRSLFGADYNFDTQYVNEYWCNAIENMIFRSLLETNNLTQIHQNILDTLSDAQVVHWFEKRIPKNVHERKVGSYVLAGQVKKALAEYQRAEMIKQKKASIIRRISSIKQVIIKLISR